MGFRIKLSIIRVLWCSQTEMLTKQLLFVDAEEFQVYHVYFQYQNATVSICLTKRYSEYDYL